MPTTVLLPALSPTMESGTLAKWHVSVGQKVASGDILAEIETDKAVMEFESIEDGTIGKLMVDEGQENIAVNTPIAVILFEGESEKDIGKSGEQSQAVSSKESPEPTSSALSVSSADSVVSMVATKPSGRQPSRRIFATPLARRLAKQNNLQLAEIQGSGPSGRIIKADIEKAIHHSTSQSLATASTATKALPLQIAQQAFTNEALAKIYQDREHTVVELDTMRRTIAERLSIAKSTIPHFYLRRKVSLDALMSFRSQVNQQLAVAGSEKPLKISFKTMEISCA